MLQEHYTHVAIFSFLGEGHALFDPSAEGKSITKAPNGFLQT
jgi:hypothetical protein